ncbi:hypothetical protein SISNIDRAFT_491818 [Sistotremastrum niveocremeum HHB9708]|uniref:Protein kinase domain-containing protein n=1 Tax=Sistotremastrum niveocremeum HHB9708 TaxID=1314777 RepID=A0A164MCL1_9AGAM|nr:hypothetical protein SISNIDRAFT_491818 [Sistotremastrum niveocremeum HHB9708]
MKKVEQLGTESSWKRTLRASSVQEETKECLDRLNEAFRMYMLQFSLAADTKLTKLVNAMQVMTLSSNSTIPVDRTEPDEIRRIPAENITFVDETSCQRMRGCTIRFGNARMIDWTGHQRAVIVKRFQAMDTCEDRARDAFDAEIELRRDLLHASFARMLGISIASRRTKMIVIEAGAISAYHYLQTLSGLEHFLEHARIMCEFVAGYRFLGEHGGSWRGGYQDVLLSAQDKRLCIGGLGRMDGRCEDSGWRVNEAFNRLRDGDDWIAGGSWSLEENADEFERLRKSATKWNEEKTAENARDLFDWLGWWSGSNEIERGTETPPTVGEIGWRDGKNWNPIPLVHHFPLAQPLQYQINAFRWREGDWETIVGTQIEGFTRWSIDASPGEEIYLGTYVRSYRTNKIFDFFYGSALSLAKDFGVDVASLRLVYRTGFDVYACLTISNEQFSAVYYFACPPTPDGTVPDPPGFWSRCPYPLCSDCRLHADAAQVGFEVVPVIEYQKINDRLLSLVQDLDAHDFLPIPDISYASDPSFATISEVSDQQAPDPIITPRGKKRHAKDLFSIFSKRRKVSNS